MSPTETFVGDQITTLHRYTPVVVCHHEGKNNIYQVPAFHTLADGQRGLIGLWENSSYKLLKRLTRTESNRAAHWLREQEPQILHFHYGVDAAYYLKLRKMFDVPAVVSFYGYDVSSFPNTLAGVGRLYLRRILPEINCFIAMSSDMKKDLLRLGAPESKIVIHYYGIRAERFAFAGRVYKRKDVCTILCVGTLEPKKGQHHLLTLLREVEKQRPDLKFRIVLVGSGDLEPMLRKLVNEFGWSDQVRFTGHIQHDDPRLVEEFHDADIFVLYSTTQPDGDKEGIPGTVVEAMAAGLPVVSTVHAGIPEVVEHRVDGILVKEGEISALGTALVELMDNVTLRESLGRAAAKRALNQLDLARKTRELEEIYDSVQMGYWKSRQDK